MLLFRYIVAWCMQLLCIFYNFKFSLIFDFGIFIAYVYCNLPLICLFFISVYDYKSVIAFLVCIYC